MQKSTGTRIDVLLDALRISQLQFADSLGVTSGAITNWKNRELGLNVINKIVNVYPNVSREWLITGEGPIFKDSLSRLTTLPADDAMAEILKSKEERVESNFDNSSLVKALLQEKDKRIEGLESQLKDKDIIIQGLREKIMMMEKLNVER